MVKLFRDDFSVRHCQKPLHINTSGKFWRQIQKKPPVLWIAENIDGLIDQSNAYKVIKEIDTVARIHKKSSFFFYFPSQIILMQLKQHLCMLHSN